MRFHHPSLYAFCIALGIHFILLLAVLALSYTTPKMDRTPTPSQTHFALTLSETNSISKPQKTAIPLSSLISKKSHSKYIIPTYKTSPKNATIKAFKPEYIDTLPRSIIHHYGDEFFDLSSAQQHYIVDNLQKIRRINDVVGNRLLRTKEETLIDAKENNLVEFYLHPDGSISDLILSKERDDSLLDELTIETIELAHSQYPRPKETTLIRIRVWILTK